MEKEYNFEKDRKESQKKLLWSIVYLVVMAPVMYGISASFDLSGKALAGITVLGLIGVWKKAK